MSHKAEVDVCGCLSTVIVSILPIVLLWDIKVRATKMESEKGTTEGNNGRIYEHHS